MITKRTFLSLGAGATVLMASTGLYRHSAQASTDGNFEVVKSTEEWKRQLNDMQYAVLREEATERPFTSPLNKETRAGQYHCVGCDQHLFNSDVKYDSKTGWPSFWQEVEGNIGFREDNKLFYTRIEEHCARCGGHLGHVFDDGPQPTGKRHCINGVAMVFKPDDGSKPVIG